MLDVKASALTSAIELSQFKPDFDPKKLAVVATIFAFAFNVGYFSAVDISLFSLFSVSEHVVFAIRALPVAVGLVIIFGIILSLPSIEEVDIRWTRTLHIWRSIVIWCWVLFLLVTGFVMWLWFKHFGLGFSLIAVSGGALWHHFVGRFKASPAPTMIYWISTAVFVAFFIGYGAGWTIKLSDLYSVIRVNDKLNGVFIVGTLLVSSSQHALIYELDSSTINVHTCLAAMNLQGAIGGQHGNIIRVVPWDTILDIRLCQSE
jgi:hypothetical protein